MYVFICYILVDSYYSIIEQSNMILPFRSSALAEQEPRWLFHSTRPLPPPSTNNQRNGFQHRGGIDADGATSSLCKPARTSSKPLRSKKSSDSRSSGNDSIEHLGPCGQRCKRWARVQMLSAFVTQLQPMITLGQIKSISRKSLLKIVNLYVRTIGSDPWLSAVSTLI